MIEITVAAISVLAGLIIGLAFEFYRHDGIRDLRQELIDSYRVAEELRQRIDDGQIPLNEVSRRLIDVATSFDNVIRISRNVFKPEGGDVA